jgi:hypothetical protein
VEASGLVAASVDTRLAIPEADQDQNRDIEGGQSVDEERRSGRLFGQAGGHLTRVDDVRSQQPDPHVDGVSGAAPSAMSHEPAWVVPLPSDGNPPWPEDRGCRAPIATVHLRYGVRV